MRRQNLRQLILSWWGFTAPGGAGKLNLWNRKTILVEAGGFWEWVAGLNPTNAASVLAMQKPAATDNSAGITVTWQSVNTRTYYVQSSTNLSASPAFTSVQSNIFGQTGTTSFKDTKATNAGPYFYRVGVQ